MYEDWLFQNQMRIRIGQAVGFVFAKFHSRRLQRVIRHASDLSNEDPEKSHLLIREHNSVQYGGKMFNMILVTD